VLFTDDGELAHRLAHPRYGHRRVYLVKVKGDPPPEALQRMVAGVRLEDGPAAALEVAVHERAERNVWIRVVVGEGRYHLVKRLCEAVGLQVQRLFRPEFGGVSVEGLRSGRFRPLSPAEVRGMKQLVGLAPGAASGPPSRALPKAQRRHGHGPPPAPGAAAPRDEERDETTSDEDQRRRPGGAATGERARHEDRQRGRAGGAASRETARHQGGQRGRSTGAAPDERARHGDRPRDRSRGARGEEAKHDDRQRGRSRGSAPARRGPGRGRK
jgi:23S rRNA pseudouridine2605 synthase